METNNRYVGEEDARYLPFHRIYGFFHSLKKKTSGGCLIVVGEEGLYTIGCLIAALYLQSSRCGVECSGGMMLNCKGDPSKEASAELIIAEQTQFCNFTEP
ncbi:hypothetical protein L2E82_29826 [Cichorium intybus]|uniref:Uncharacterized protein n=1 Tax=Cichorium intybus TaxID=13427 RepID=A0ACB9CZB6_CICIN|nr:hypothetical protein L2E82_29826 [Cichorium intybus]